MAIELKFSKSDNDTPWGFRLTGGADCDVPLTVLKVTEDSIAENAGLQVDDMIVRIDDQCTAGLTHVEAHDVLLAAAKEFSLVIRRGETFSNVQDDEQSNTEVCNILEGLMQKNICSNCKLTQEQDMHLTVTENVRPEDNSKFYITDQQIAEAISGETEVLPDQNILGVNFNKVDLTESTVLKVIEEETAETKIDVQNKKWSTFMQKPTRPKVVPKKTEQEGPKAPPYRVIIKKQKKKDTLMADELIEASKALAPETVDDVDETDFQTLKDEFEDANNDTEEKDEVELEELDVDALEEIRIVDDEDNVCLESQSATRSEEVKEQTVTAETSLSLEEQLAQVQQQLQALAQLPSAIQVTLDSVTQQLAKIVRATHKKLDKEEAVNQSLSSEDEITEQVTEAESLESTLAFGEVAEMSGAEDETKPESIDLSDASEQEATEERKSDKDSEENFHTAELEELLIEEERQAWRSDNEKVNQQERKTVQMDEFHQRRLEQRPTYPLAPLQRPIILPGGRKWSQPDDALQTVKKVKMTDEKISETLNTYSEVITGRTKGLTNGMFFGRGPIKQNLFTGSVLHNLRRQEYCKGPVM